MKKVVAVVMLVAVVFAAFAVQAWAQTATDAGKVTTDAVKAVFDAQAFLIMFVWGLLCKYLPALKKVPNDSIPWVNLVGYILVRLGGGLVTDAHAAGFNPGAAVDAVGALVGGFANASWARLLYEGFARPVLEKWLGVKRVPA